MDAVLQHDCPSEEKVPQDLLWGAKSAESEQRELWGWVSSHPRAKTARDQSCHSHAIEQPPPCLCKAVLSPGSLSCVRAGGAMPTLHTRLLLRALFACVAQQGDGWHWGGLPEQPARQPPCCQPRVPLPGRTCRKRGAAPRVAPDPVSTHQVPQPAAKSNPGTTAQPPASVLGFGAGTSKTT